MQLKDKLLVTLQINQYFILLVYGVTPSCKK